MAAILKLYDEVMAKADPLCENYPFMGSPWKALSAILLYLLVVWQGPKWMAPYNPLQLKWTLVIYNFALVLLSLYISLGTFRYAALAGGYSVLFFEVEKTRDHENREIHALIGWWFFFSKLIEFLDTVFFIVRKKNNQLTFLHVYHHAAMAVFTWLGLKFLPGGSNIIYPMLNSMVHAIMYTYYGLSACGPGMKKYLWWKKYLTMIQIGQFIIYLVQDVINIAYGSTLPGAFAYPAYLYNISILVLFLKFYTQSYSRRVRAKAANGHQPASNGQIQNGEISHGEAMANGEYKKIN